MRTTRYLSTLFLLLFPFFILFYSHLFWLAPVTKTSSIAYALMFYIGIRSILLNKQKRLDVFITTNYIFFYVSSGLAVVSMEINGERLKFDWAFPLKDISIALMFSILSLLVIEYVYLQKHRDSYLKREAFFNEKLFLKYSFLLTIFSIALSISFIVIVGTPSLFSSRAESRMILEGAIGMEKGNALVGIFYAFTKICPLCITSWNLYLKKKYELRLNALDYFALISLLITINPISSARFIYLILVITLGLSVFARLTLDYSKVIPIGILFAIFIFPNLDFSRYASGTFTLKSFDDSFNTLSKKDYDQIPMGALSLQVLNGKNAPLGKQFIGEMLFWVPRTYWQEKPLDTSKIVSRAAGLKNDNLSIPLWSEGWASFRLPGVIGLPWIYSRFARRKRILAEREPSSHVCLFFLSGCSFIILRGPLLQATGIILFGLITLYILSKVERRFMN